MVYSVQVKRLRNQDPLESLVWQTNKRKRTTGDSELCEEFVFRLAKTFDTRQPGNRILLQGDNQGEKCKLHSISKKIKSEGSINSLDAAKSNEAAVRRHPETNQDLVPPELQQMISEYISQQQPSPVDVDSIDTETEDYVYDLYLGDSAGPRASGAVGYIELSADEEKLFFEESDNDSGLDSAGDEDSNAEDYYKNDYPDEEQEDERYESDELGDALGDLKLSSEWSEDNLDEEDSRYARYGWK